MDRNSDRGSRKLPPHWQQMPCTSTSGASPRSWNRMGSQTMCEEGTMQAVQTWFKVEICKEMTFHTCVQMVSFTADAEYLSIALFGLVHPSSKAGLEELGLANEGNFRLSREFDACHKARRHQTAASHSTAAYCPASASFFGSMQHQHSPSPRLGGNHEVRSVSAARRVATAFATILWCILDQYKQLNSTISPT